MILQAGCTSSLFCKAETPVATLLLPCSGDGQTVRASDLGITPAVGAFHDFTDAFGNLCRRAVLPAGESILQSTCTVETPDEIAVQEDAPRTPAADLPDEVLQYLLPSRYCPSDLLAKDAEKVVRGARPGYGQVEAIRSWIHRRIRYKYGVSNESTSAADTLRKRAGVCRDFSHLGIAFCRVLGIPARMVSGFLHELDPMDLHAWFEAYVGGRWYTFDATQKKPRGNRIILAYGRDAADIAQITNFAPLTVRKQIVWVRPA